MLYPECFKRTGTDSSFKSSISFDVKQSVGYAAKDLVTVTIAKYICSMIANYTAYYRWLWETSQWWRGQRSVCWRACTRVRKPQPSGLFPHSSWCSHQQSRDAANGEGSFAISLSRRPKKQSCWFLLFCCTCTVKYAFPANANVRTSSSGDGDGWAAATAAQSHWQLTRFFAKVLLALINVQYRCTDGLARLANADINFVIASQGKIVDTMGLTVEWGELLQQVHSRWHSMMTVIDWRLATNCQSS